MGRKRADWVRTRDPRSSSEGAGLDSVLDHILARGKVVFVRPGRRDSS